MSKIATNTKKGNLYKSTNGIWYIEYIAEEAGENNWHNYLPIYELEKENEQIADLKMVEKFNKPISELKGLEVKWGYMMNNDSKNFNYRCATLV